MLMQQTSSNRITTLGKHIKMAKGSKLCGNFAKLIKIHSLRKTNSLYFCFRMNFYLKILTKMQQCQLSFPKNIFWCLYQNLPNPLASHNMEVFCTFVLIFHIYFSTSKNDGEFIINHFFTLFWWLLQLLCFTLFL